MKTILTNAIILILVTIGAKGNAQSLSSPFELLSFTAQVSDGQAVVLWSTGIETNTAYFTIDRTTDGVHYTTIDTVQGAGNSDFTRNYQVVDNNPIAGTSYYRLSETSMDGTVNHFSMTSLVWAPQGPVIKTCYERQQLKVHITSNDYTTYTVQMINLAGKVLVQQNYSVSKGENDYTLYPNVNDGLYIINVVSDNVHYTNKLLIGNCAFRG